MKNIDISRNQKTIIDDEDYDLVSQYKWFAVPRNGTYYVRRVMKIDGYRQNVYLHRFILGNGDHYGDYVCDHINGNPLDNRRSNLRKIDTSRNCSNQKLSTKNSSGYKGVSFDKRYNNWLARIGYHGKILYIGSFKDKKNAALAYDKRAVELFGECARTNRMMGLL